jgi:hypothetical protein
MYHFTAPPLSSEAFMQICAQCSRHVRDGDSSCPFCAAPCTGNARPNASYAGFAARSVLLASVASASLGCKDAEQAPMAIYGAPPPLASAAPTGSTLSDAGAPDANVLKVPMDIYGAPSVPPSAVPSSAPGIPSRGPMSAPIYGGPPPRKGH